MQQELIWFNGDISPLAEATVSVEDRGFQFADGVYEVVRVYNGRCFALAPHIDRFDRSANGIRLHLPIAKPQLCDEIQRLVDQSKLAEGMVYAQLTRGVCERNHRFPQNCKPTLLFYTRKLPPVAAPGAGEGIALQSVADLRWKLCWIKSIALLANVLAKNEAVAAGAEEAVFVDNGLVSECSTSNLFAVIGGRIVTHPLDGRVLPGITRDYLLQCAREIEVMVEERPMTEAEAMAADEVFITSTTREVGWVSRWNGQAVGGGDCGPITEQIHRALLRRIEQETRQAVTA